MGSRRGPEQTIGQDFKMKLLLAACMLGLATAGQDYQMFMEWAKTKALESCWGEENMKLHTVNMKKAVAKCQQVDAPELNLPPFRLLNRFTNNLVGLAYKMEDQDNEMQRYMQYYKFSKMMDSMKDHSYDRQYENQYKDDRMDMMEKMKMMEMMMKYMPKFQSQERQGVYQTAYKTDDNNNNIDVTAMKEDMKQYKMPSQWFEDKYVEILDSCYEVSETLPGSLQEEYAPSNYNGPMRNLGKIKSFMNCCKSAKMKLCMYQDTKKKIEANFGPVDELEGLHNQLSEEQVFLMVNELLEGPEEEYM